MVTLAKLPSRKRQHRQSKVAASLLLSLCFGGTLVGKSFAFTPFDSEIGGRFLNSNVRKDGTYLQAVSSITIRPITSSRNNVKGGEIGWITKQEGDIDYHRNANRVLENLGVPFGLRQVLLHSRDIYKKRVWIVDNSGSMAMQDGHLVLECSDRVDNGTCSRWAEVEETVNCHAMLAGSIYTPTEFRLLNPPKNGPQSFRVGYGRHVDKDCKRVKSGLSRNSPRGQTELASSLEKIRNEVLKMLPELTAENQKVAIVIATDGCNYNKDNIGSDVSEIERNQALLHAIKSLQGLPVTLVTRLCTDHEPLLEFYNVLGENLSESRFGIDLDVIEHHTAEAEQVYKHNPWVNYALVLHRIREMGQDHFLFDLLDEKPFTRGEIKQFCTLLFGYDDWPNDWVLFLQAVHTLQHMEKFHVNPITQKAEPWIDIQKLFAIGCYWSD